MKRSMNKGLAIVAGMAILSYFGYTMHADFTFNKKTHPASHSQLTAKVSEPLHAGANRSNSNSPERNVPNKPYRTYHNPRYGFTVDYPSAWNQGIRPTDSDGLLWYAAANNPRYKNTQVPSHPNDVVLQALGIPNVIPSQGSGKSLKQMLDRTRQTTIPRIKKEPGILSVRFGEKDGWIWITTVQKVKDNAILCSQTYSSPRVIQSIQLIYPENQQPTYEPIWKHVSASFIPGNSM